MRPSVPTQCRRAAGFTLIELMLVLVLAGLLSSLAWPSYSAQMQRSRRADGVAALLRLQAAQEAYKALHDSYAQRLSQLVGVALISPQGYYQLSLSQADAQGFVAQARATGTQAADQACPLLSLRSHGGMQWHAPDAHCWNE